MTFQSSDNAGEQTVVSSPVTSSPVTRVNSQEGGIQSKLEASKPIDLTPAHGRLLPLKQFLVVYSCLAISVFLCSLDQTVVACITPVIASEFGSASSLSWVGTAFLLTSTAFAPIYGRMSDVFGRKPAMITAQIIFLIGQVICGFAPSMMALIIGRAIAGIGGAGILSLVMICVSDVVALRHRGKYHGILGSFNGAGSCVGPIVGAILGEKLGWRYVFYLELPIIGVALIATAVFLPSLGKPDRSKMVERFKSVDYLGMVTLVAGCVLTLLSLNLIDPPEVPFASANVLGFLLGGIALLVIFGIVEWKVAKQPIMPLPIFKNISVDLALTLNGTFGWVFYAAIYYIPLYFQVADGQSLLQSSISLLPVVVGSIALSWFSGLVTSWTGNYKISILLSSALMTIGSALWYTVGQNTSMGKLIGYNLILGIGFGCQMQNGLVAVQSATPQKEVAMATAVRNFFRNIGGVLGLAFSNLILTQLIKFYFNRDVTGRLSDDLITRIQDSPLLIYQENIGEAEKQLLISGYVNALRIVFLVFIPLSAISLLVAIILPEFHLDRSTEGLPQRKTWDESTYGVAIAFLRRTARRFSQPSTARSTEASRSSTMQSQDSGRTAVSDSINHEKKTQDVKEVV